MGACSPLAALRAHLAAQWTALQHVLRTFDLDGNGSISKDEWTSTLSRRGSGVRISAREASALFDLLDVDRTGEIGFRELHDQLRRGFSVELNRRMQAGSVYFDLAAAHKAGSALVTLGLQATDAEAAALFNEIDADRSGLPDYAEIRKKFRATSKKLRGRTRPSPD